MRENNFETEKYPVLPILFRDGRGSMIEATNVHRNTPQAQLDINKDGLRLILNPSKLITEHPFHLVGAEALPDVESLIDSTYLPLGVELNWPYAECTRLDQAHQAEMDEPLAAYGEILSCLKGKRLENIQYPNGSYFRNGQREVVFYGKAGNLKKYYKSEMGWPARLFRGEVKFKNKEEVERRFGTLMWEGKKLDNYLQPKRKIYLSLNCEDFSDLSNSVKYELLQLSFLVILGN